MFVKNRTLQLKIITASYARQPDRYKGTIFNKCCYFAETRSFCIQHLGDATPPPHRVRISCRIKANIFSASLATETCRVKVSATWSDINSESCVNARPVYKRALKITTTKLKLKSLYRFRFKNINNLNNPRMLPISLNSQNEIWRRKSISLRGAAIIIKYADVKF